MKVAVLIASHNGAGTVAQAVESARRQADVYVVSDGSTDGTAMVAFEAGARIMALPENVGKPVALRKAFDALGLRRYEWVLVVDDDTVLAPDFVERALEAVTPDTVIVVGHTGGQWPRRGKGRWNTLLGGRAYAYWKYQLLIRRAQSTLGVMTCISGSNSMVRTEVLAEVLGPTPYIVDDTYWTLEVQRRKLGRIAYARQARAWVQDPTNLKDWYRQNLRWLHGSFQGIRGHRVGTKATAFDFWYGALVLDWLVYIVGLPVGVWAVTHYGFTMVWALGYLAWAVAAAVSLRRWELVVMAPALVLQDWLYRVVFLHALLRSYTQPTSDVCRWTSPERNVA